MARETAVRLKSDYFKQLHNALAAVFQSRDLFRRLAQLVAGKDLQSLDLSGTLYRQIEQLIRWSEQQGKETVRRLVDSAFDELPYNRDLQALAESFSDEWFEVEISIDFDSIHSHSAKREIDPKRGESKVLDAAIKSEVTIAESTLLLILVRDQDSPGLYSILELEPDYMLDGEDIRQSRPFKLHHPLDDSGNLLPAPVDIIVNSPDFNPPKQSQSIEVPAVFHDEDEIEPLEFLLTPLITGILRVLIEVYQHSDSGRNKVGSKPLSTICLQSQSEYARYRVASLLLDTVSIDRLTFVERADIHNIDTGGGDFAARDLSKKEGGVHFDGGDVDITRPVVGGSVGELVMGNKTEHNEIVHGDKVGGDKISKGLDTAQSKSSGVPAWFWWAAVLMIILACIVLVFLVIT